MCACVKVSASPVSPRNLAGVCLSQCDPQQPSNALLLVGEVTHILGGRMSYPGTVHYGNDKLKISLYTLYTTQVYRVLYFILICEGRKSKRENLGRCCDLLGFDEFIEVYIYYTIRLSTLIIFQFECSHIHFPLNCPISKHRPKFSLLDFRPSHTYL